MTPDDPVLARVLRGTADQNVRLEHLRRLLARLGFQERVRGVIVKNKLAGGVEE